MAVLLVQGVAVRALLHNMKNLIFYIFVFFSISGFSQETLSQVLDRFNNESIPYMSVEELAMPKTKAIILDARERLEYDVSHLKNAIFVGYDYFTLNTVMDKIENKNQKIVVYCSLGVRSEDIAEKLKKAGYKNVYNLYGGIFEWKNKNFPVYDNTNRETESVHACSKQWSKWLINGKKVF